MGSLHQGHLSSLKDSGYGSGPVEILRVVGHGFSEGQKDGSGSLEDEMVVEVD